MHMTLSLDDELATLLARQAHLKGLSCDEMVNVALRRGLVEEREAVAQFTVVTRPHSFGFKPGVDLDKLDQLVDELEIERFVAKLACRS